LSSTVIQEPASNPFAHRLRAWLPTLFWLGAIAAFSQDTFSAAHTGGILMRIIHAVYGPISHRGFEQLHFFVRKTAHFTVYGILSCLAFLAWRTTLPAAQRWTWGWTGLAMTVVFAAASLDEFHQTFIPSRTGTSRDVLLDLVGAMFFQILIAVFLRERQRERDRTVLRS
jgi:VanZ family protein